MSLFSELHAPENADFVDKNPAVVGLAVAFGAQLELDCPDWLMPTDERGNLEIYPEVGAVIARNVLSKDLVGAIYEEQVKKGVYMSQSENGVWFFSNYYTRNATTADTETRLDNVYHLATGCTPDQMMNRYEHRDGVDGYQFPHLDRGLLKPTIALAKGPGATRVAKSQDIIISRSTEGTAELSRLKDCGLAIDLNTGVYDITVFDGQLFTHHGVRTAKRPETEEPRLSLLLTSVTPA